MFVNSLSLLLFFVIASVIGAYIYRPPIFMTEGFVITYRHTMTNHTINNLRRYRHSLCSVIIFVIVTFLPQLSMSSGSTAQQAPPELFPGLIQGGHPGSLPKGELIFDLAEGDSQFKSELLRGFGC